MSSSAGNVTTRNRIILGVIGAVVLCVILWLGYQNYSLKADKEQFEYQIEDLNVEILDLEEDLRDLESEIQNKDLDLEEKDRMLAEKEMELKDKTKTINRLLKSNRISKEQAAELSTRIDQLNYYIKKYQVEIDQLKAKVDTLTREKYKLEGNVAKLESEKTSLKRDNLTKQTKLEAAAILKALDISTFVVKGSGKVVEREELRAGRVKKLKFCFNILENVVAEKEQKWIYITMDDPSGNTITDMTDQSGFFIFQDEEKEYTVRALIDYNGVTQEVCQVFERMDNQEFVKGVHTIRVFADGYEIGNSSISVK